MLITPGFEGLFDFRDGQVFLCGSYTGVEEREVMGIGVEKVFTSTTAPPGTDEYSVKIVDIEGKFIYDVLLPERTIDGYLMSKGPGTTSSKGVVASSVYSTVTGTFVKPPATRVVKSKTNPLADQLIESYDFLVVSEPGGHELIEAILFPKGKLTVSQRLLIRQKIDDSYWPTSNELRAGEARSILRRAEGGNLSLNIVYKKDLPQFLAGVGLGEDFKPL